MQQKTAAVETKEKKRAERLNNNTPVYYETANITDERERKKERDEKQDGG